MHTLILGAVAYDAKVVTIWDGFRAWFDQQGLEFDYILYTSYERQVEAHLAGHIHVAWNSPLAWIQAERAGRARGLTARAVAMRDSDRDLRSVIVTRADGPQTLQDLRGGTIGVGAGDSPQATMIPLDHLAAAGLDPGADVTVRRHDVLLGKHGDHIGGERDAVRALMRGEVDAACILDANHLLFAREGTLPPDRTRVLAQTGLYDHCNFTVYDEATGPGLQRFVDLLLGMRYDDPAVRPLLDLEGLRAWMPGRTEGYALLNRAVDRFGALNAWLKQASG